MVQNSEKQDICVLYRQYDGYLSAHGQELADFLRTMRIGNGIQGTPDVGTFANGLECLAGQMVAHFKKDSMVGGFYMHPSGTRDVGEEYTYIVTSKDGKPHMAIHEGSVAFFGMPGSTPSKDMPCIWEGFASDFNAEQIEAGQTKH